MFEQLSIALPDSLTFNFISPGDDNPNTGATGTVGGGQPSYFDLQITNTLLAGNYDGYCIDTDRNINASGTWSAKVFSSYETLPPELIGNDGNGLVGGIEKPQNFDLLNWIINQNFAGKELFDTNGNSLGFATSDDIQRAIWSLIDDENSIGRLATYNPTPINGETRAQANARIAAAQVRADKISELALTYGEGFVPSYDYTNYFGEQVIGKLGVILIPDRFNDGVIPDSIQFIIAEVKLSKLGDFVFEDNNANGIQETEEEGIEGVTVNLLDKNGNVIATTTTDDNGEYSFTVVAGEYKVEFVKPNDYQTSPVDAGGDDTKDSDGLISDLITLVPGENNPTIDSGFYQTASLGDTVFVDNNGNGVYDGDETGVGNVTVNLLDCDGNAILDANNNPITTTTDGNGNYLFEGLKPGEYKVEFILPTGYSFTQQSTVEADVTNNDSDAGVGGLTGCIELSSGEKELDVDAGIYQPASLGDTVFEDKNGNGVFDGDETGVGNVTVNLLDCDGNAILDANNNPITTTTDGNGNYLFEGLKPGEYKVEFILPTGYRFTQQSTVEADVTNNDSDAGVGGLTGCIELSSGEKELDVDAGIYQPASMGDTVFVDNNGNGIYDAGDVGKQGVIVNLYACDDTAMTTPLATDTTDGNGNYLFEGLKPGEYKVEFILPTGYSFTQQSTVEADVTNNDSDAGVGGLTGCIELSSGENELDVDAGIYQPASMGDTVFVDNNGNGIYDAGDVGKQGVIVNLYACDDTAMTTPLATDTTDDNGNYLFEGLKPGEYKVEFILPNGYSFTQQSTVEADVTNNDSDAGVGGLTGCIELSSGEKELDVDAGIYQPASLGDTVFVDNNGNGQQDAGENGIDGVKVELYTCVNGQPGTLVTSTTTANGGNYNFDGLKPGEYIVKFITPDGYTQTTANVGADGTDSDAGTGGFTGCYTLASGETNNTVDAGFYKAGIDIEKLVRGEYQTGGAGGTEGLTPGFWKTHSEFGPAPLAGWPESGYSPTQSWELVFGKDVPGTPTLLDALGTNGGGLNALLRHATAALLNAANPNVDYAYTIAQVINMTQMAITSGNYDATKNIFETQNEKGADLSTPAGSSTTVVTSDFDADTPGSGPQIPVGGKAIFTYVVTNTGTVDISDVSVTDNRLSGLIFLGGDINNDNKLNANETWLYGAEEIVTSSAEIANIGTVTGTGGTVPVTDSDKAHYNGSALIQSLGDFVWFDTNVNGLQDDGEAGIGGLQVTLISGGADGLINGIGDTTTTTTTDSDGYYQFNGLMVDVQYQVIFSKPSGTEFTTPNVGSNDTIDSDANTTTGKTQIVTLTSGENNPTLDAGIYQPSGDLSITKTDGLTTVTPGQQITYTIVVQNNGTITSTNALVKDIMPSNLTNVSWTSVATGGATDNQSSGTGNINDYVTLAGGSTITYTVVGKVAASTTTLGSAGTFSLGGNSALDGTDGNIRTFTATNGVQVKASAFSQLNGTTWSKAYLGSYGGGLGVTNSNEGNGGNNMHVVDNSGSNDYVLFEFSESVVVDKASLGYVVGDSDISVWIGTANNPFSNHLNLNSSVLSSLGFTEINNGGSSTRTADINNGNVAGNVLVIAAKIGDCDDNFKVNTLNINKVVQSTSSLTNTATITAPNGFIDTNPNNNSATDINTISSTPNQPVVIRHYEAENMNLCNYQVEYVGNFASNKNVIKLTSSSGTAKRTFDGLTGTYDVIVGYFDENDGTSSAKVKVGNNVVASWVFNQNLGSNVAAESNFVQYAINNVALGTGNQIELSASLSNGEYGRFDYVKIVPSDTVMVSGVLAEPLSV